MGLIGRLLGQFAKRSARVRGVTSSAPVVEPHHLGYFENGQQAFLAGRIDEARLWFGKLEAENTSLGIAWIYLGNLVKMETGGEERFERALACYARARQLNSDPPELAVNIAGTYLDQQRAEDALRELEHARDLCSAMPYWHYHYGRACEMLFDFAPAKAAFDRSVQLAPDFLLARKAAAGVLGWMGEFAACVAAIQALTQHGQPALEVGREFTLIGWIIGYPDLVKDGARRVLAVDPGDLGAQFSLGNVLLHEGDITAAWPLLEARTANPVFPHYKPVLPLWQGEDLRSKHLWVYEEQGFGDCIMFMRFLPLLLPRAARVTVQCKPEMRRLWETIPGIEVVPRAGRLQLAEMPADFELPLLSIPARLAIHEPAELARTLPLVLADAWLVHWRSAVEQAVASRQVAAALPRRPRVGLAITGAAARKDNQLRSVPAHCFEGLLVLDCDFFWVQPEATRTGTDALSTRVIDITAGIGDFADTAALLRQLDLVITIDTAVAHLAAALGLETWVLLPRMRDWRWDIAGHGCLWYPRVRSWRVAENLDWNTVLDQVRGALETRMHQGFPASIT